MPTITTKDGVEIFYKDWAKVSRSCSATLAAVVRDWTPDAVLPEQRLSRYRP